MADGAAAPDLGQLMGELRPRLHRYCARMVGSALDGEDVLQDALAKAAAAGMAGVDHPERWLFRIAHNTALDALRARRRREARRGEADAAALPDPAGAADARVAAAAGLAHFLALPPAARAAVVMTDVLGHSLDEVVETLGVTPAAAKAALHRGRRRLRDHAADPADPPPLSPAERARLAAYADRFNARDFEALRALLAEDVRLELVDRLRLKGRQDVGVYFTRYAANAAYVARPCLADGRPALAFHDPADGADYVAFFEEDDGRLARIRDFRYARYCMEGVSLRDL
ncbi:sigma-70 family RNA polymerase sigma factor [Caulobacter sp. KR2-114]|uniref:sigma-70 family RNA polymerase sigma factor n=1 Tax=Caulobacter sp. KR2-114 TaxID=3400912 RepID=UPI003C02E2F7